MPETAARSTDSLTEQSLEGGCSVSPQQSAYLVTGAR